MNRPIPSISGMGEAVALAQDCRSEALSNFKLFGAWAQAAVGLGEWQGFGPKRR